mmetsp:Transcript_14144/g.29851  ORF Transcript_14144/g.29851 Transcript_14144/m.29851 type:complete len:207 (-) Transcript_14144:481-1101(-)
MAPAEESRSARSLQSITSVPVYGIGWSPPGMISCAGPQPLSSPRQRARYFRMDVGHQKCTPERGFCRCGWLYTKSTACSQRFSSSLRFSSFARVATWVFAVSSPPWDPTFVRSMLAAREHFRQKAWCARFAKVMFDGASAAGSPFALRSLLNAGAAAAAAKECDEPASGQPKQEKANGSCLQSGVSTKTVPAVAAATSTYSRFMRR